MKRTGLTRVKTASLLAVLLSFSPAYLTAAEKAKETPVTIRPIAAGGADVGFANVSTAIVGRSRGTPIVSVAQLGYIAVTILWREETDIKTHKDLEGKSWAISPGQAQWFLLPALARINNLDFKSIKIEETAPPLQPAALLAKKADF